jgi:PAS domain S-box-containing protein
MKEANLYSPRLLVVDDEQTILDEFQEILCPNIDPDAPEYKLDKLGAELFAETCPSSPVTSFDLVRCQQGDEAVEKVRAAAEEDKPFAVVFLDVRMPPGPDGVWTAEHIRELDPDIQIVIVTAYSDVDPLDISRRVLPADKLLYVQKPFHPHEIRQFASALQAKWLAEKQLRERAIELERTNEQLRHEIAEHERTEEKRQLLSHAIMSTDDSVYISDMENKIIFVNRAFCETYGYDEQEVIGKDSAILWIERPLSEHTRSVFQIVRDARQVVFYHKRKDGNVFPISLSRSIVKDSTGNEVAVVGVARDMSERVGIENEFRSENLQLKKQNQLISEFVTAALEEARSPLCALKDIIIDAEAGALGEISPELWP